MHIHTAKQIPRFLHKSKTWIIWMFIPLALSSFTHLWNPMGFPVLHVDESHNMRRAMQVMQGLGPQESKSTYDYGYDHPYFGQLILAAAFSLINYPDSLNPSINTQSIEMLFLVPRVLMGIFAVVDTFLVYKIVETRYSRRAAFISSTLFAVMPLSWILRGLYLDSIELPFILLSILFAIYCAKRSESEYRPNIGNNKNIILILLSGIFLGLAIFTKMPIFTMIPLIVYIILKSSRDTDGKKGSYSKNARISSKLKVLGIWFIPVALIPLIWPAYALSLGQLDDLVDGLLFQTTREGGKDLRHSVLLVAKIDPVLLGAGAIGLIYSVMKKDYFILLWAFPYLIFLYFIGWVVNFHWAILLPVLTIVAGTLIEDMIKRIGSRKFIWPFPYIIISSVAIFGFAISITLITSNVNNSYIELYLFTVLELGDHMADTNQQHENQYTTMIGSHRTRALVWIPMYIFNDKVIFRETDIPGDNFTKPVETKKFLIFADSHLFPRLTSTEQSDKDMRITKLYYNNSDAIATFIDEESDRYIFMNIGENHAFGQFVEVRANY